MPTIVRPPEVIGTTQDDPTRAVITVSLYATPTTGGLLQATFLGDPDLAGVVVVTTVYPRSAPGGGVQRFPYDVRGVSHDVTVRLKRTGAVWAPVQGQHADTRIRKVSRYGVGQEYPTDAAVAAIMAAAIVTADAAVAALPWGWRLARVTQEIYRQEAETRAVETLCRQLQEASQTLQATRDRLAQERVLLRDDLPAEIRAQLGPVLIDRPVKEAS